MDNATHLGLDVHKDSIAVAVLRPNRAEPASRRKSPRSRSRSSPSRNTYATGKAPTALNRDQPALATIRSNASRSNASRVVVRTFPSAPTWRRTAVPDSASGASTIATMSYSPSVQ